MDDNQEMNFKGIYGICAHHVYGGSTIIFNDLLSFLGIKKRFFNEKLMNKTICEIETDYISFQSLSKSPLSWLKFLGKFLKTSYYIFVNTRGYNVAMANELISILYIFPHKMFRSLNVIYYCHSAFRDTAFNKIFLSRFINHYSEIIVVPSIYLKNDLIKMGINDSKIQCIYNGIDELSLAEHLQNSNSDEKLNVCIVGIIQHQKGQDIFIEAINNLNRDGYNITGNIVGPIGEKIYFEELKKISANAKQVQTIKFIGPLDHQSSVEFMNTQDVIICLSRFRETLPTVLIEALSLRKAVIGTSIGGTPEIITDGENGYLIERDNVKQLEQAILKLKDPVLRSKLGESGYNIFRNKFNRETFEKQHKLLIQQVFSKTN